MLLQIITLIISIILWFLAPKEYSYGFCMLATVLFLVVSVSSLMKMRKHSSAIILNILFLFSYFLSAFAYPTFIFPYDDYFFKYGFDEIYINKGTALALVGICSYLFGIIYYYKKKENRIPRVNTGVNLYARQSTLFLQILVFVVSIFFFFHLERDANLGMMSFYKSLVISVCSLILFRYSYSSKSPLKKMVFSNLFFFIISAILGLALLTSGDRGPTLFIFLTLITTLLIQLNVKRMLAILLPMIILGTFYMFAVQQMRSDEESISLSDVYKGSKLLKNEQENIWNYGSDLINSSRNIYLGMEYVYKYDYFYGKQYILFAGSTIPYMITLLETDNIKSTGTYITEYHQYKYAPTSVSGMGTQVSVDLYMDFGIIGVLIVMYLFGVFAGFCSLKWYNNIYALVGFLFLASTSIYIPRSSLLLELRVWVWAILIVYLNSLIFSRPKYRFLKINHNRNTDENSCNK